MIFVVRENERERELRMMISRGRNKELRWRRGESGEKSRPFFSNYININLLDNSFVFILVVRIIE